MIAILDKEQFTTVLTVELEQVLRDNLEFTRSNARKLKSLENTLVALKSLDQDITENSDKKTFQIWAESIEIFTDTLEDMLDLFPNEFLTKLENLVKTILAITSQKASTATRKEEYRKRLRFSAYSILYLIEQREEELENDNKKLIRGFMVVSESSLSKVWLNPEEDEAWKDL